MSDDFHKLKSILLQEEIDKIDELTKQVVILTSQQDKKALIEKLSTLIVDILSKGMQEQRHHLYATLQPLMAKGLLDELNSSNNDLKRILFPIISSAIQDQVHKQKETIIDALYPIMGNMIGKYVTSAISNMMHDINDKIELTLSFSKYQRMIKAKLYGITEAELLMRESNFTQIRNVFLIQKDSGLLITELHREDESKIHDAEMVASMLSAIRSFVNNWIANHETMREISEIEYGDSSISIESAGSCYLAVLSQGDTNIDEKLRQTLSVIVDKHSHGIVNFDGDRSKLDIADIQAKLATLFEKTTAIKKSKFPFISSLLLLGILAFPAWFYTKDALVQYHQQEIAKEVQHALRRANIHIYDMGIEFQGEKHFILNGLLLNARDAREVKSILLDYNYTNQTQLIEDKFYSHYTDEELSSEVYKINKEYDSNISYLFENETIDFKGEVIDTKSKLEIVEYLTNLFEKYKLNFAITTPQALNQRVYFEFGSGVLQDKYLPIIDHIAALQKKYKNYKINLMAYTDLKGTKEINSKIAQERAEILKEALIARGVAKDMITIGHKPAPPPDIKNPNKEDTLSRCVTFEWSLQQ